MLKKEEELAIAGLVDSRTIFKHFTSLPKSSNGRANCVPASAPRVQCSVQLIQLAPAGAAVHVTAVISP